MCIEICVAPDVRLMVSGRPTGSGLVLFHSGAQ